MSKNFCNSTYFHDLGVFLHFQNNDILRNLIFINPEWATNAIYKIIDTKEIVLNYGKFNSSQLPSIWKGYPEAKYPFLIELMKKIELCFLLPESNNYLVPELLHGDAPNINWDYTGLIKIRAKIAYLSFLLVPKMFFYFVSKFFSPERA